MDDSVRFWVCILHICSESTHAMATAENDHAVYCFTRRLLFEGIVRGWEGSF